MFGRVAPRYDLLNRLLSGRVDVYWRNRLTKAVRSTLSQPQARVLDLCCGTGDVALALERERMRLCGPVARPVIASDFCRPMLDGAQRKLRTATGLLEADAMRFPLPDASVDLITVAFGFRNLANYSAALEEFARLLAPNGRVAILEFSQPTLPGFAQVFDLYFKQVLPRIGNAVSGAGDAYSYLQRSVDRFLTPEELGVAMQRAGLRDVFFERLTFGVSCLHVARRP
ncbi:MAG: ubiquinone/menaquinone biosynthesis methyltransferase [Acidobacteria bacterium]|nr:ubiquinone/menaquinone biosynthesis methyltransferase [Acidobacteriota bacterium]